MKKRALCVLLCLSLLMAGLGGNANKAKAYTKTAAATDDYTKWKQTSSTWGNEKPWPKASWPKFGDGGCWITSVAILLRHYNVVTETSVKKFNPIICNNRLMKYGIIDAKGDFQNLKKLEQAYSGFSYKGTVKYSLKKLKSLYDSGYACIVHETRDEGHYVAVKDVTDTKAIVMDPGYKTNKLTKADKIQYFKVTASPKNDKDEGKEDTGNNTDSEGTNTDAGKKDENAGTSGEPTVTEFDPYQISYITPFLVSAGETCIFYSEGNDFIAAVWGYNLGNIGSTIMEVTNLDRNGAILSQNMYIRDYINAVVTRYNVNGDDSIGKSIIKVYYGSARIFGFSSANLKNKITATLETGGQIMENPLSINKENITLNKGKSFVLTAESKMPEYELESVDYKAEKSSIASVDANGKVTANKKGTTKIIVTGSGGFQKECIVTVK